MQCRLEPTFQHFNSNIGIIVSSSFYVAITPGPVHDGGNERMVTTTAAVVLPEPDPARPTIQEFIDDLWLIQSNQRHNFFSEASFWSADGVGGF